MEELGAGMPNEKLGGLTERVAEFSAVPTASGPVLSGTDPGRALSMDSAPSFQLAGLIRSAVTAVCLELFVSWFQRKSSTRVL